MEFRSFRDRNELLAGVARELRATLARDLSAPAAVVLAGGKSPYPAYDAIAQDPPRIDPRLWLSMSDERMVPSDSDQNNHHNATGFFKALGIGNERLLPVPTDLPGAEAAALAWETAWKHFFLQGGNVPLVLLGLGADGHTAGLFTDEHLRAAEGKLALGLYRPDGLDGVSLTPDFFRRAQRVLILAPGEEKKARIADLKREPLAVTAGKVLAGCARVEVWHD